MSFLRAEAVEAKMALTKCLRKTKAGLQRLAVENELTCLASKGLPLKPWLGCLASAESRLWAGVFSCCWDGPLQLQPEEVQAVRWVDLQSDWQRPGEQYAPDSQEALARLLKQPSWEFPA